MSTKITFPNQSGAAGDPRLVNGSVEFLQPGTLNFKPVFANPSLTESLKQQVALDGQGVPAIDLWIEDGAEYRVIFRSRTGAIVHDGDLADFLDTLDPGHSASSVQPARGDLTVFLGTSLVQQNHIGTAAKISTWGRGWLPFAEFFLGRSLSPIWSDMTVREGWEPSGVAGATRGFQGLNAGVSGQTLAQIWARRHFIAQRLRRFTNIGIDAGTNDMGVLSKEEIHAMRIALAKFFLARGKRVFMATILSRATSSWPAVPTGAERKKAAWINQKTREFCASTPNCHLFDWNKSWVDNASANGEPRAGYSNDGIHFAPPGGVAVGEHAAEVFLPFLAPAAPRVWSPDDKYDATNNPLGNLLSNPFCTGTGGSHGTGSTGASGVATGMRSEVSTGNATVVASKEARTDGRGDWQVLTYTPNTQDSLAYFRTATADTTHALPAGTWVQASIEVEIGAFNGWQGISLYLKDNGVNGMLAYGLEAFDDGAGYLKLPNRAMKGVIVTPPFQIVNGSPSLRWRLEVRVGSTGGGASGTGVLKAGAVELRPVADPRLLVDYAG